MKQEDKREKITVSERELKCLEVLVECYQNDAIPYFCFVAKKTGLTEQQVRRSVRSLARKGFAEHQALVDDDGMVAGSGYGATLAGVNFNYPINL